MKFIVKFSWTNFIGWLLLKLNSAENLSDIDQVTWWVFGGVRIQTQQSGSKFHVCKPDALVASHVYRKVGEKKGQPLLNSTWTSLSYVIKKILGKYLTISWAWTNLKVLKEVPCGCHCLGWLLKFNLGLISATLNNSYIRDYGLLLSSARVCCLLGGMLPLRMLNLKKNEWTLIMGESNTASLQKSMFHGSYEPSIISL